MLVGAGDRLPAMSEEGTQTCRDTNCQPSRTQTSTIAFTDTP